MKRRSNRSLAALAATGMIAAVLPLSIPGAANAAEEDAFGGFSASANATPLRLEIFEPSIPIPSSPQVELRLAYTKALADSGTSTGRASYLWPGDAIGEGVKTFFEQLGLPTALVENGYPVQINAGYPSGEAKASEEPFPGMVMRTNAADSSASASAGFSTDNDVEPKKGGGLPGLPGLPGLDGLGPLSDLLSPILGGGKAKPKAAGVPGLPPELALLVDVDGLVSTSKSSSAKGKVTSSARANLGEVKLLGGIIRISGIEAISASTTDGTKGANTGKATYGILSIAGQKFAIGPDGVEAAGKTTPIPGLNDNPAKALEQLGIKIEIPKPVRTVEGDQATSTIEGLRVELDTKLLRPVLSAIPSTQLAELIPAEAGPLKGLVGALSSMAPRIVLTLGIAQTTVETVPVMDFGDTPAADTGSSGDQPAAGGDADGTTTEGTDGAVGGGDLGGAPGSDAPLADADADADTGAVDGDLPVALPVSATAGLPPLGSIPGMLLFGGIALAAVAGSYFRKIGALALGAGAPCPHGLDSGLPDLRKM